MSNLLKLIAVLTYCCLEACSAICEPSTSGAIATNEPAVATNAIDDTHETELKANKRYNQMLSKMQAAVEEIAQLYGDPVFLQIFTNDVGQASELKERLRIAKKAEDLKSELSDLERKREELLQDIALKQREASKLSEKLILQRRALEALSAAIEQAKDAVEDTVK
jgi:hypothetical protein